MSDDKPVLVIAACSTWSLRAWLTLTLAAVEFDVQVVSLENDDGDICDPLLADLSPTGLVPVLHHGDTVIHDSLSIVEYVNETWADGVLWPEKPAQRALARSLCAELHSGFMGLRQELPFAYSPQESGALSAAVETDLARLTAIWQRAQDETYFSQPGIVDTFYAVMALRLDSYGISLDGNAGAYQANLLAWSLVSEGMKAALSWAES